MSFNTLWTVLSLFKLPQHCPDVGTVLKLSGQFQNCPDNLNTVRTVLKGSRWFWFCPDSSKTVRTVLKLSRQFKTVQMVLKLYIQCGNCLDGSDTVWTVPTLSGLIWKGPDGFNFVQTVLSGRFQTVRTVFKLSGRFSNCPDGFKTIWTLSHYL